MPGKGTGLPLSPTAEKPGAGLPGPPEGPRLGGEARGSGRCPAAEAAVPVRLAPAAGVEDEAPAGEGTNNILVWIE